MGRYTPKQIEKYQRQKYIAYVDKVTKNLFRMLRDEEVGAQKFRDRFVKLCEGLDGLETIRLDSEYLRNAQEYINRLRSATIENDDFDDEFLKKIREPEMSNLNRLQKLKSRNSYKKDKHKDKSTNEDWG